MRYLSMFSGIEAATVAWHPLGWEPAAFCEIEAFPAAVLAHRYPHVPNLGDVTKADFSEAGAIDLAVFGSPCQSFSVAGKRLGLDDPRGNLALLAGGVVRRKRARWFVFENVPGLLSSDGGWDFGTLLAAFAGYPTGSVFAPPEGGWGTSGAVVQAGAHSHGLAWRVLDAQYFGVAQRRRRVFVVGYLGDWRRAAAVLFERHSLQGHPAPRREKGQGAPAIPSRSSAGGGFGTDFDCDGDLIDVAPTLNATYGEQTGQDFMNGLIAFGSKEHAQDAGDVSPPLRAMGSSKSHPNGGGQVAIAFGWQNSPSQGDQVGEIVSTLDKSKTPAVAFDTTQITSPQYRTSLPPELCHTLNQGAHPPAVFGPAVRRLTPMECERLQGFPDQYTLIPWRKGMAPDGPRYKALGNSMAVPVMAWIGRRIAEADALTEAEARAA